MQGFPISLYILLWKYIHLKKLNGSKIKSCDFRTSYRSVVGSAPVMLVIKGICSPDVTFLLVCVRGILPTYSQHPLFRKRTHKQYIYKKKKRSFPSGFENINGYPKKI